MKVHQNMQQMFSPSFPNSAALQFNLLHSSDIDSASTSTALYSDSIVSSCLNSNFQQHNDFLVGQNLSKPFSFILPPSTSVSSSNLPNHFLPSSNFVSLPPPDNCLFPQQICSDYSSKNELSLHLIINDNDYLDSNFGHDRHSTSSFNSTRQGNESVTQNLQYNNACHDFKTTQNLILNKKQSNLEEIIPRFEAKKLLNSDFLHINGTNNQTDNSTNNSLISNLKMDDTIIDFIESNLPIDQQIMQVESKY